MFAEVRLKILFSITVRNCFVKETVNFDVLKPFIDIDECTTNPCDVNAACSNTNGSFECTCRPGFDGNGNVCQGKKNAYP